MLANPTALPRGVQRAGRRERHVEQPCREGDQTIYIGPNHREFVSQGVQVIGGWQGQTGAVAHRVEAGVRYHYDRIDRLHTEEGFLMRDGNLVPVGAPSPATP